MKRLLFAILFVCQTVLPAFSQSANANYVLTETLLDEDGINKVSSVQYYDGLGWPIQEVRNGVNSTQGAAKSTSTVYDECRRVRRQWLPIAVSSLDYDAGVTSSSSDPLAYSGTTYDALDRPVFTSTAGSDMQGRGKSFAYTTNAGGSVMRFSVSGQNLIFNGYYPAGTLYGEKTTDEDGNTVEEFKDITGSVILVRRHTGNDTYYVYDNNEQLAFVLPPALPELLSTKSTWSAAEDGMREYAYCYRYDNRGRMCWKQLPGCAPVTMRYDAEDRLLFVADGELSAKGRQRFYLYDDLGREVICGICDNDISDTSGLHALATYAYSGQMASYNTALSLSNVALLYVNYYDDYRYIGVLSPGDREEMFYSSRDGFPERATNTTGLLTGKRVYEMPDSTKFSVSAFYYDIRGQLVYKVSTNHLGGTEKFWMDYTFTGQQKTILHEHSAAGKADISIRQSRNYESCGLLRSEHYSINGSEPNRLALYTYDGLGRVSRKLTADMFTTNYTYDVRSWPLSINSGSLFSESLHYTDSYGGSTACFNGNISAMTWKTGHSTRSFKYTYDDYSRLVRADYMENGVNSTHYQESFQYDVMGNVEAVERYGLHDNSVFGKIDDLSYTYEGNQVRKIDDAVSGPYYAGAFHFVDGSDSDIEYEYDRNGNVTKDLNKGITSIQYNALNLPVKICYADNSYQQFVYDAEGHKLSTTHFEPLVLTPIPLSSRKGIIGGDSRPFPGEESIEMGTYTTTYYCGDIVYDGSQRIVLNEHGYAKLHSSGIPQFHYYLKDHLGNIRVVLDERDVVEQVNHYYAFGGLMGESYGGDVQRYKYNGKELERLSGLDWYDYGARFMDGMRFTGVDSKAELKPWQSPYTYGRNNPLRFIDPDGNDEFDKLQGFARGIITNLISGTNLRDSYTPNNSADYNAGLKRADKTSLAVGTALLVDGGKNMASGLGGASASVVATVASGGTAVPVTVITGIGSLAITAAGAAEVGVGVMMLANTSKNSSKAYKRGNDRSNSSYNSSEAEHKKNARPSTVGKHQKGQSRKYKDKGNEKGDARRIRYK